MSEKRRQTFLAPPKPRKKTVDVERNKRAIKTCEREIALDKIELEKHKKTFNNLERLWKNSMTERKEEKLHELRTYIVFYETDIQNYKKQIERLQKEAHNKGGNKR